MPDEDRAGCMQLASPGRVQGRLPGQRRASCSSCIHFAGAGIHPAPRRVMNDLGFTHLSVAVADISATVAKV